MAVEIRPIRADEVEEFTFINSYAFNADRGPKALEEAAAHVRASCDLEWTLAALIDGRMTACMRVLPFTMLVNGAPVEMGGVAGVASLPEHRRQGCVGAMLRRALADMRERGQAIAGLYTPHPSLYRRFGWEIASTAIEYSFSAKNVQSILLSNGASCRRISVDDWRVLNEVYQKHAEGRNGLLARNERWWRQIVMDGTREPWDAVLCESRDGEAVGYMIYRTQRVDVIDLQLPHAILRVRELVALDGEAYTSLLNYLLSHDVHHRIDWHAPPDEPFLQMIDDPFRVKAGLLSMFMLRLVDVPKALEERGYGGQEEGKQLVLSVRDDDSAPWNRGTWELTCSGEGMKVSATSREPDFTLGARTLAAVYSGHVRMSTAARAGLVEIRRPQSLPTADEVFTTRYPPFCMDLF